MSEELRVEVNKIIAAPIERVFDAWLDPAMLTRFILPMPGMPNPEVENDPREGGRFNIVMQVGENKILHSGTYLTIERPHRLVFSWESPRSTDGSEVRLLFTAIGESETRVTLTHLRFIDEEARADHEGGWSRILDTLAGVA